MLPIWSAAILSFSEGVGLIQGRAAMAQFPRPFRVSNEAWSTSRVARIGSQKPKNHRQGIAGGFGDLHQSARVSLKTLGPPKICRLRLKILHEPEC
jgi:hypothetical protein